MSALPKQLRRLALPLLLASIPAAAVPASPARLPRLVDVGAGKCIPCKAMTPILEQIRQEYAGRLSVEFIDVWKNPRAADPYRVEIIPTQVFFDASGREVSRHQGFMSKEEILARFKSAGVPLAPATH
ncbi:MAG TPA: thioredoxin family protein [Anaeromyxobacteraceae bacterium]|jgi:thioredoxin 1|nr:thioredoxin family protein [Anaeromyxobacteraceae bacterium]